MKKIINTTNKAFSLLELSIVLIVIGFLVAGITGAPTMIRQARISGARQVTKTSPVMGIDDLIVWLEPTLENSFLNSSGGAVAYDSTVYEWKNQAGLFGYLPSAIQSSASAQPTLIENGIHSLPTLRFDGVNDCLTFGSHYIYSYGNGLTIFAVVRPSGPTLAGARFVFDFGQFAVKGYGVSYASNSFWVYTPTDFGGASSAETAHSYSTDSVILEGLIVFNSTQSLTVNGTSVYSAANTLDALSPTEINESLTSTSTTGPSKIGGISKTYSTSRYFLGDISEIIIYDRALSSDERDQIRTYLRNKYKI